MPILRGNDSPFHGGLKVSCNVSGEGGPKTKGGLATESIELKKSELVFSAEKGI